MKDMEKLNMDNMEEMNDTQAANGAVEETATEEMTAIEQGEAEERKFTQKDVDDIVRKRLERERKKYESLAGDGEYFRNELIEREKALIRREYKVSAVERLRSKGLPIAAADLLNYNSPDEFEESYKKLVDILAPILQNAVKEVFKTNGREVQTGNPHVNNDTMLREAFRP